MLVTSCFFYFKNVLKSFHFQGCQKSGSCGKQLSVAQNLLQNTLNEFFPQIVCSICELVETSASDIRSGWRPLFGALRAVRIEYTTIEEVNEARQRHVEAVLDVFDVYLNTDNILVFANATVDCILCLLKYVRGPGKTF